MDKYILIVAENSAWLRAVTFALRQHSFEPEFATSDSEGLLAAITFCPDVVVVEANIGRIDGCQVAKALRALPETRNIAILAIADSATHLSISEKSCDFDNTIALDTTPEEVVSAVHAAITSRSAQEANSSFRSAVPVTPPPLPRPAMNNTRETPLTETQAPHAAPDQSLVSDKHANLFAKWPTTQWFAIPASMAAAMAAKGAEILTAEEMTAKEFDQSGASRG